MQSAGQPNGEGVSRDVAPLRATHSRRPRPEAHRPRPELTTGIADPLRMKVCSPIRETPCYAPAPQDEVRRCWALSGMSVGAPARYFAGAPASSHAASTARSSGVISVILPGGMALDQAAFRPMMRALTRMWSASSSRMPRGAVVMLAHTGSAAWQGLHRDEMMFSTALKLGVAVEVLASRGPAAERKPMAIIPAAATPQVHHGDPLPACR